MGKSISLLLGAGFSAPIRAGCCSNRQPPAICF